MQISRLFTIVYLLMERESVTAAELADRFEVSTRTIYRDLDKLTLGGIPIYTNRGKKGGISLTEGFVIDRSLLSSREQKDILLGLQNLKSLNIPGDENGAINGAINKLGALFKNSSKDWIGVDLAPWGGNPEKENIFLTLKKAILEEKIVHFTYYGRHTEPKTRYVEPCQLRFKSRSWYLYAYCLNRNSYRLFKLSRLDNPKIGETSFIPRPLPDPAVQEDYSSDKMVQLIIKIDSSLAWRVYDEFPSSSLTRSDQGDFIVRITYPEDEWVYGYLMSFGDKALVLSPGRIRGLIKKRFLQAVKKYS